MAEGSVSVVLRHARAALALCAVVAAPALAALALPAGASTWPGTVAGGSLLASRGVVVDRRAPALPRGLNARAWLLADVTTGAVLAARDPHGAYLPASTMKILTALAVLPLLPPARQLVVTSAQARVDGSRVGLVPGVRYSVRELATAMLIASGNDAATALSDAVGGAETTKRLMNATAAALGAHDTHAVDPTGLDAPGQVTSAYDMALLARAALAAPSVRAYLTLTRATVRGAGGRSFQIQTHNELLGTYPGTIGVKNGYTVAAGGTYIGAVRRGGHTLVVTLLHARPDYAGDARALLDWGFAHLGGIAAVGTLTAVAAPAALPALVPVRAAAAPPAEPKGHHGPGWFTWTAFGVTMMVGAATFLRRRLRRKHRYREGSGALPDGGTSVS